MISDSLKVPNVSSGSFFGYNVSDIVSMFGESNVAPTSGRTITFELAYMSNSESDLAKCISALESQLL